MLVGLSPLSYLKSYMSSFVAFELQPINLAEHSRSNFALVVSFRCAGENFPTPFGDVDEGCQWEV
jgi:hypothetical protein